MNRKVLNIYFGLTGHTKLNYSIVDNKYMILFTLLNILLE